MRTYISSTKDATLYQRYPTLNTGLDEILEVGKVIRELDGSAMYASASTRFLVDFDITSGSMYPSGSKYYLNLYLANAQFVNRYQRLEVFPVSRSWVEGSGYRYQDVVNAEDGVSWDTGSVSSPWTIPGGDYTTSISSSYTVSQVPIEDIKIDVTALIAPVIAGTNTTPWFGLIIKFPDSDEQDSRNLGNIRFFSGNTHTIYEPKLEVVWNDQTFITGSLKPIVDGVIKISPKNLKEAYTSGEIDNIRLVVRDTFPDKRFDAVQRYSNKYYLPSESYYRIVDEVSGVVLQDFDQYSAINCDESGSYITLDTRGMFVNRYYRLDLKIKSGNLVFFPEFSYTFKIDRND